MDRHLIEYLPYIVRDYAEYQAIAASEQPEFNKAWDAANVLLDNQYVGTSEDLGLGRWEEILELNPKGTDSYETRRLRILARLNARLPYTIRQLRVMLESLCGEENATVSFTDYTLQVDVSLSSSSNLEDIRELLERIVPQNMCINMTGVLYVDAYIGAEERVSYIADKQKWNYILGKWALGTAPYLTVNVDAWQYKIGTWTLGAKPFNSIEEEIVAKDENISSIKQPAIDTAVQALLDKIHAIQINSDKTIANITKSTNNGIVTVTGYVPVGYTDTITHEALLSADGNILTEADVYIPITGTVKLLYHITVKETGTNG